MKSLLNFFLVFLSFLTCLKFANATDVTCTSLTAISGFQQVSDDAASALSLCKSASPTGSCYPWNRYVGTVLVKGYGYSSGTENYWYPYSSTTTPAYTLESGCGVPSTDDDNDGLPNNLDAYPNDPAPYQFQIVSRYYDANGNCIGYMIYTSKGDYILMSDLTLEQLNTGLYTDHTLTSDFVNSQIWQDSTDLVPGGGGTTTTSDNTPTGNSTPVTATTASDLITQAQDNVTAQIPTTITNPGSGTSTSQGSTTGDSDSTSLGKLVGNTDASNQNLQHISEALGITNNLLAQLNSKTGGSGSGTSSTYRESEGTDLTAEEIGDAVGDSLIDPSQTFDNTTTNNIPSIDQDDNVTDAKNKFSDRYDSFINNIKGSDLFTEPFGIFSGPTGTGSSLLTVDIGSWGNSTNRTVTIDFSEYSVVWTILRSVLLLLASFACFKIIVLKKG